MRTHMLIMSIISPINFN